MSERKSVYNPKADKKWNKENKEHRAYLTKRSNARSFIRNLATREDLDELTQLINDRMKELDN